MPSPQLWFVPPAPQPGPGGALPPGLSEPEQRWAQALPLQRQGQYGRSRAALRQVLGGLLQLEPLQVPLHSPPGQPPRLADAHGWVSLSHAAGGVLLAWSPQPVGVDLERAERRFDAAALAQRFFPPAERQQLAVLPASQLRSAVLRSWLAKEAAIKWRQRTLAQELADWSFDHRDGRLLHGRDGTVMNPCEGALAGWRWAAVGPGLAPLGPTPVPLIWRFADEGSCSKP